MRRQSADEERLDDRRLAPALFVKAQADLLDQRPSPVMAGDLVERREAQAVRQTQVVEPARVVVRDDIVTGAARAEEVFSGGKRGVAGAEVLGVGACCEEQARVQPARKVAVQPLPVVLQMVFGKIVLHGADAIFRAAGAKRVAVEYIAARHLLVRSQPGEKFDRRVVLDQMPGARLGVRVVVPALAHVLDDPLKRRIRRSAA
jgi:hypothetical protein